MQPTAMLGLGKVLGSPKPFFVFKSSAHSGAMAVRRHTAVEKQGKSSAGDP